MSRTVHFRGTTGETYYAKALPLTTPWATGAVVGSETGTTGSFAFAALSDATAYEVFKQSGGSPADSDEAVAAIDVAQVDLVDAPNSTAVAAIANATEAAMINEGDATALLQAIADKIAGDLTAGDLTALAIVSAIKTDATLAQMISRIDADISSRSSLDAAGLRSAVGLASANLDSQLDTKPSYGDTSDRTKVSASASVLRETTTKVTS